MQRETSVEDPKRTRPGSSAHAFTALAIVAIALSLTSLTQASSADPTNLVTNGGFEATTANQSIQLGKIDCCNVGSTLPGGVPFAQYVNGWTADGLVLLFMPAPGTESGTQADSAGALYQFTGGPLPNTRFFVWGPGIPASNPGPENGLTLSPNGGNMIGLDGDPEAGGETTGKGVIQGQIEQTINGLVKGDRYKVTFDRASAQQWDFTGDVQSQLRVSLCGPNDTVGPFTPFQSGPSGCSQYTSVFDSGNHGFKGWEKDSLTFTADSNSEILSFLGIGLPIGEPPLVLIDGISMQQVPVPEPKASLLLGIAFAVLTVVAYRRPKWLCLQG